MSQINVNRIKDSNEGAPDFPSGVNVGGITSTVTLGVTNLNPTNLNVSGVVTATTLDGNLLATGTPTLGLGVTINTSGVNISGVATAGIVSATTLYGDGSNLTGIALSIAPLNYNPSINDMKVTEATGIGFTFNQGVKAGSGNVTLSLVSVGSTLVENFSVGSSVTYGGSGDSITITPTSSLDQNTVYAISYPSGAFTSLSGEASYVGTAYTFKTILQEYTIWAWGSNSYGLLGQNQGPAQLGNASSPVQIPGITWGSVGNFHGDTPSRRAKAATKNDGTLWMWGSNAEGMLGQNDLTQRSSPVQIPGTTWSGAFGWAGTSIRAVKTDGTMWTWGKNVTGSLGQNEGVNAHKSSPVQIPGTTWSTGDGKNAMGDISGACAQFAIKTDGTLWSWGDNLQGQLGQNTGGSNTFSSSPAQVGSDTTWNTITTDGQSTGATKTDGTAWTWGYNEYGQLGHNQSENQLHRCSSPIQIPGTTWANIKSSNDKMYGVKTDGTLWGWGVASYLLGPNNPDHRSSPTQIPGTTWKVFGGNAGITWHNQIFPKTDGTLWGWGSNADGVLAQNNQTAQESPVQISGTTWNAIANSGYSILAQQLLEE